MGGVLVVGAGPVGLTMAAELARHGVRARIVDKLVEPLPFCRAIGVTPRTLEVYEDMGVAREMIDAGLWLEGLRLAMPGAPPRDIRLDLSDLPYGELGIRQSETERILAEHLGRFGIAVERGVALADLMQDEGAVSVVLDHAGGRRETASFAYVVGCDGAHSAVRRALGIAFEGEAFPMGFMLGEATLTPALPRGVALRALRPREDDAPDMLIAIPLPEKGRYRISTLAPGDGGAGGTDHGIQTDRPGPSLARLQEAADRLMPGELTLSDLGWSSSFRISMRLAERYRVGRAFLAGDAAHIHPPTGGQGMNTGIHDAYNLAWKLALVVSGRAGEGLLASYEAERRPVGADVVARTKTASMSLGREREKPHRLADTQILVAYRASPVVAEAITEAVSDDAPRAGDRAPDAAGLVREHVGFPLRLFDLLRGTEHVLVVHLGDDAGAAQVAAVEALAERLTAEAPVPLRILAVGAADARVAPVGVPFVRDAAGAFAAAYKPAAGTAYLVRPDGYIGLVARPWEEATVRGYFDSWRM
jgi:2-polyprenyl-6-methoxyphenol hydroxylase-like FAD-dependent oxidoreductase